MTTNEQNKFGQTLGQSLSNWQAPAYIDEKNTPQLIGNYATLKSLSLEDTQTLYESFSPHNEDLWTYLPYGPCYTPEDYHEVIKGLIDAQSGCTPYAIYANNDADSFGVAIGMASYLRIEPKAGSIEIGHLAFSPVLQRTRIATEAIYLLIKHAFEQGYRRVEWKCNDLNAPSIRAAKRFGFNYEGTFRQATVVKGRNRDTAWFSIIDSEWAALQAVYEKWLSEDNFGENGHQIKSFDSFK